MRQLQTSLNEGEDKLKKSVRAVAVMAEQRKGLQERVRELEREERKGGNKMDANHLKKLQDRVKTFQKGLIIYVHVVFRIYSKLGMLTPIQFFNIALPMFSC